MILDGLTLPEAARLRVELLHRDHAPPPPDVAEAAPVKQDVEEELVRADPRWVRFAPFTLTGAVTGLALLGVLWRVVSEAHVNLNTLGPVRDVSHRLERWPLAAAVVVVAAGVVAFVVIASTVGYVLAFWRFRVTRHSGGTLHVTRGLITTRATSIEQRRLRGAEVSEPLLLRSVRGARCLAIATGLRVGRGAERGGEILLPPAPRAAAVSLAATVIGTDVPFTEALARHPVAARHRRVTRALAGPVMLIGCRGRSVSRSDTGRRGCWSSPRYSPARPSRSASIATTAWAMRSPAITLSPGMERSCDAASRCRPTA